MQPNLTGWGNAPEWEGCESSGGEGWIRTNVGVSQQIYSLPPLATRAPLRGRGGIMPLPTRHCQMPCNNFPQRDREPSREARPCIREMPMGMHPTQDHGHSPAWPDRLHVQTSQSAAQAAKTRHLPRPGWVLPASGAKTYLRETIPAAPTWINNLHALSPSCPTHGQHCCNPGV